MFIYTIIPYPSPTPNRIEHRHQIRFNKLLWQQQKFLFNTGKLFEYLLWCTGRQQVVHGDCSILHLAPPSRHILRSEILQRANECRGLQYPILNRLTNSSFCRTICCAVKETPCSLSRFIFHYFLSVRNVQFYLKKYSARRQAFSESVGPYIMQL